MRIWKRSFGIPKSHTYDAIYAPLILGRVSQLFGSFQRGLGDPALTCCAVKLKSSPQVLSQNVSRYVLLLLLPLLLPVLNSYGGSTWKALQVEAMDASRRGDRKGRDTRMDVHSACEPHKNKRSSETVTHVFIHPLRGIVYVSAAPVDGLRDRVHRVCHEISHGFSEVHLSSRLHGHTPT